MSTLNDSDGWPQEPGRPRAEESEAGLGHCAGAPASAGDPAADTAAAKAGKERLSGDIAASAAVSGVASPSACSPKADSRRPPPPSAPPPVPPSHPDSPVACVGAGGAGASVGPGGGGRKEEEWPPWPGDGSDDLFDRIHSSMLKLLSGAQEGAEEDEDEEVDERVISLAEGSGGPLAEDNGCAREASGPSFREIQMQVRATLEAAADNGQLESFLDSLPRREAPNVDGMRRRMVEMLEAAAADGAMGTLFGDEAAAGGGGSEASTPRSAINEAISVASSSGDLGRPTEASAASGAAMSPPPQPHVPVAPPRRPGVPQSPRVARLQAVGGSRQGQERLPSWPRHVRRVRWTKAMNAPPAMANLQQPLNLEMAHDIVRPRPRGAAGAAPYGGNQPEPARHEPHLQQHQQQLLPQLWQKERTTPIGLVPQMRIPGRYALATKPSRDMRQPKLRAIH